MGTKSNFYDVLTSKGSFLETIMKGFDAKVSLSLTKKMDDIIIEFIKSITEAEEKEEQK